MEEEAQGHEGDDEEMEDAEEDTDADETTVSGAGDDNTASGAGDGITDGGERTDGSQPKRQWKAWCPNTLGTIKEEFNEVNPINGLPTAPADLVKGYGAQLGYIVRSSISINTDNLRHPD